MDVNISFVNFLNHNHNKNLHYFLFHLSIQKGETAPGKTPKCLKQSIRRTKR